MRQGANKRSRGRNGRNKPHIPLRMQTFDSSGPDVRIRGNAWQVHERYMNMARDAFQAGDRIAAENFFQHADHYYRLINFNEDGSPRHDRPQHGQPQPPGGPQPPMDGNGPNGHPGGPEQQQMDQRGEHRGPDQRGPDQRGQDQRGHDQRGHDQRGEHRGHDHRGGHPRGPDQRGPDQRGEQRGHDNRGHDQRRQDQGGDRGRSMNGNNHDDDASLDELPAHILRAAD